MTQIVDTSENIKKIENLITNADLLNQISRDAEKALNALSREQAIKVAGYKINFNQGRNEYEILAGNSVIERAFRSSELVDKFQQKAHDELQKSIKRIKRLGPVAVAVRRDTHELDREEREIVNWALHDLDTVSHIFEETRQNRASKIGGDTKNKIQYESDINLLAIFKESFKSQEMGAALMAYNASLRERQGKLMKVDEITAQKDATYTCVKDLLQQSDQYAGEVSRSYRERMAATKEKRAQLKKSIKPEDMAVKSTESPALA